MNDISLHILDICQNAHDASATLIQISIVIHQHTIDINIKDNGQGIDSQVLPHVTDPFYTSKKVRKVGLGLSLFKQSVEQCHGHFNINSTVGIGTLVHARLYTDHIDAPYMGNLAETMLVLMQSCEKREYELFYQDDNHCFVFSTTHMKMHINYKKRNDPKNLLMLKKYIQEGLR